MTQRVEWIGFGERDPWGQSPESYTSVDPWSFTARIETQHADGTADVLVEGYGVMHNAQEGDQPGAFRNLNRVSSAVRNMLVSATSRLPSDTTLLGVAASVLRAALSQGSNDATMQDLVQIIESDAHDESVRACAALGAALLVGTH